MKGNWVLFVTEDGKPIKVEKWGGGVAVETNLRTDSNGNKFRCLPVAVLTEDEIDAKLKEAYDQGFSDGSVTP